LCMMFLYAEWPAMVVSSQGVGFGPYCASRPLWVKPAAIFARHLCAPVAAANRRIE
jgi:hypothetical protein